MKSIFQTESFKKWFKNVKDNRAKISILKRLDRIQEGNFGDYKSVGEKVFELRIDVGQGYRVYYLEDGIHIILLLIGGNKNTQREDIVKAKKLAKEYWNGKNN